MSDYDLFLADCPARTTLEIVGNTWSVVVVIALAEAPRRHGELLARIGGVSKKMLSQTLRRLQASGIVVHDGALYELTELGRSLEHPVRVLAGWAETHAEAIAAARDGLSSDRS